MSAEDKAQDQELQEWERNQKRHAIPTYAPGHPLYGSKFCHDCDDPIATLRRAEGANYCVDCTTRREILKRRTGR